ncbi:MAG: YsnF/AvaK domain-containing protein [Actinomycetota bacterium]|nr:YsnF/AvaK domain-containing protein [Actinomycetota bacterium]
MTRSEEELTVGTAQRESGRARLHRYVVTEMVTKTVPVQREEVRIERETISEEREVSEEVRKERIETEGADVSEARDR